MNAPTPVSALLHAATMVNFFSCHCVKSFVFTLGRKQKHLFTQKHSAICWDSLQTKFISTRRKKQGFFLYYETHKKILDLNNRANQQETSSVDRSAQGSSETVRRKTFQFDNFYAHKPQHKTKYDATFLQWFIGFVEGDGSFVVHKKQNKVYFDLTQHLRDISLLYKIKTTLGFGSVLERKEGHRNVAVYYVTGKENFLRLVLLFNGNLICSAKKTQFKRWLCVFNMQYGESVYYISSEIQPSWEDAWLSGFIDAEGCFNARAFGRLHMPSVKKATLPCICLRREARNGAKGQRVKNCRTCKSGKNVFTEFAIAQKQVCIIKMIYDLFDLTSKYSYLDVSAGVHRFRLGNYKQLGVLISYLNKYKLKTKKVIDFQIWARIVNMKVQKSHLTIDGLKHVIKLCNSIRDYKKS